MSMKIYLCMYKDTFVYIHIDVYLYEDVCMYE